MLARILKILGQYRMPPGCSWRVPGPALAVPELELYELIRTIEAAQSRVEPGRTQSAGRWYLLGNHWSGDAYDGPGSAAAVGGARE